VGIGELKIRKGSQVYDDGIASNKRSESLLEFLRNKIE
jgi:hypothetical protein